MHLWCHPVKTFFLVLAMAILKTQSLKQLSKNLASEGQKTTICGPLRIMPYSQMSLLSVVIFVLRILSNFHAFLVDYLITSALLNQN